MSKRNYRNPPIEEALVEIQFAPSKEWDPTISLSFYDKIKDTYVGKPQDRISILASIKQDANKSSPLVEAKQELDRVQYPDKAGTSLVSIGHNVMSVHVLRPYPGWESFFPKIEEAYNAYIEASDPAGVVRIGLRYINKIEIPSSDPVDLRDYFNSPPSMPDGISVNMSNFFTRTESTYKDAPIRLIQTFGTSSAPENAYGFLLDIDLVCLLSENPLPCDQALEVVDDMRTRERDAFEAYITDTTREIFDAE